MPKHDYSIIIGHPDNDGNLKHLNKFGIRYNNDPKYTLLMHAVLHERMELANVLLSKRANPNAARGRSFPLLIAATNASSQMIGLLLKNGADINQKSPFQWTALHKICISSNTDMIRFLVEQGANITDTTSGGDSAVHLASRLRKTASGLHFLIKKGAQLNSKNKLGYSPLHIACLYGNHEGVTLLIKNGASICAIDSEGKTPFAIMKPEAPERRHLTSIQYILHEIAAQFFIDPFFVNQQDINLIKRSELYKSKFENLVSDLVKMREIKFFQQYSYISVLKMSKNMKKLSNLCRNEEFIKKFKLRIGEISFYQQSLNDILDEALQLKEELVVVESRVKCIFSKYLPALIIRKISNNLCAADLQV